MRFPLEEVNSALINIRSQIQFLMFLGLCLQQHQSLLGLICGPAVPVGQTDSAAPVWPAALCVSVWPVRFGGAHYSSAGEKRSLALQHHSPLQLLREDSSHLLSTENLSIARCYTLCHLNKCSHSNLNLLLHNSFGFFSIKL